MDEDERKSYLEEHERCCDIFYKTGRAGWLSDLRRRRLLQLAGTNFNCKAFYHDYYWLCAEGLTGWCIGMAHLTPAGESELQRLLDNGI